MQDLFKAAVERGASDIHIKSGDVIRVRIHGVLQPLTQQKLSPDQVKAIALKLIPHEEDREQFDKLLDYDCSWGIPGIGRFRVNIMRQRGSPMIVMRVIPIEIPTFDDLGLPKVLNRIADHDRGMILVTGVTGSGKSSTQAAMINWMNQRQAAPCRDPGEPDRVPPPRQQVLDHSARHRHRYRFVRGRTTGGAPSGSRCDPDRRDA